MAEAFGAKVEINYRSMYPVTVNDDQQTTMACDVAASIFGEDKVLRSTPADMGSEDFSYMLQERPGCYLAIGAASLPAGQESWKEKNIKLAADLEHFVVKDAYLLHSPNYDFNDEILPLGATLFARLAEYYLGQ
jgi:hippurate hydrolase